MYRTILLYDGYGLESLSALLKQRPHVGMFIQNLYCLFSPKSHTQIQQFYDQDHVRKHGLGSGRLIKRLDLPLITIQGAQGKHGRAKGKQVPSRPVATISWASWRDVPSSLEPVLLEIVQKSQVKDLYYPHASTFKIIAAVPEPVISVADPPVTPAYHSLHRLKKLRIPGSISLATTVFCLCTLPYLNALVAEDLMVPLNTAGAEFSQEQRASLLKLKQLRLYDISLRQNDMSLLLDLFRTLQIVELHSCYHRPRYSRIYFASLLEGKSMDDEFPIPFEWPESLVHLENIVVRYHDSRHFLAKRIANPQRLRSLKHISIETGPGASFHDVVQRCDK